MTFILRNDRTLFNILLFFVLSIIGLACLPTSVFGQSSSGIRVQPSFIEEAVNPGDTYSEILQIKNESDVEETYYVSVRNIKGLTGNDNAPVFADEGEVTGLEVASWVTLSADSATVLPGETAQIPFSVVVPKDASPGSHIGGIFVTRTPPRLRETGAGVGIQVVSILSMKIGGDVIETARIREFSSDKNIYSTPKAEFTVSVENEGNILIRPQGFIEITNMFGERVAQLKINERAGAVLPKAERRFSVEWEGDSLSFGRYQVHAGLVFGDYGRQNIESNLFIWVLPMKIITPFLGGLLFLVFVIYISIRIHVRNKLRTVERTHARFVHDEAPLSKLTFIAVAVLAFTILFLLGVFIFFA